MYVKTTPQNHPIRTITIIAAITLFLFVSVFTFVKAENNAPQIISETPFSTFTFTLLPNQESPLSIFNSGVKDINFSLAITGTSSASNAELTVFNASNASIWNGIAADKEVLWGNTTLTNGNNTFKLKNTGTNNLTLTLKLFNIPTIQAPTPTYSWAGSAAPAGENSEIDINFPVSGLYTFDFSVNSGEQFEFLLGTNDIQRTVNSDGVVSLFVDAGVQTVKIVQDTTGDYVDWQVDMTYSGVSADPLPYTKSNNAINTERMPIHLSTAAKVNMVITATTGTVGDQLLVNIVGAEPQLVVVADANVSAFAGETTWTTFDLPAGTSSIELTTPNGLMGYEFAISVLPSTDYVYTGIANPGGQNSRIRLTFATAGLYDFVFGDNGRYQFMLNVDDNSYIQKTVEGTSAVTYYVPAGTHDLIIDQDTTAGSFWSVDVSLNAAANNSLPYTKTGGDIGGLGNDFSAEWLPISLATASNVNLSINAEGGTADSFSVEVYESGSNSADYTLSKVLGTEEQWTNFQLSAGINRLKIVADDNNSVLAYDLEISAVPTNGTMAWSGNVLDVGLSPAVQVNFPTTGLYRFDIESSAGFANLVLDDHVPALFAPLASPPDLGTGYDLQVEEGLHEIYVVQDAAYANTTWTASVAPSTAEAKFFEFTGTLNANESVTPLYPVPAGTLDFNFSLEVTGNDVALEIVDGDSNTVWSGSALDGETIWGTGTLTGNNELTLTNAAGTSADVALTLYHIPDAGYAWDGYADSSNAVNSEIRVNFPSAGLYTFDLNADSGRYQFLLDSDYIQKTIETGSTDSTYFVPSGMQYLKIVQDTNPGNTDWDLTISNVGAAHDSLPYTKSGGDIGGTGNDFDMELLPINLSTATAVNIATTMTGSGSDNIDITVFDSDDTELETVTVNAGETTWTTLDLPAGTSRLQVKADGNTATAKYDIVVSAIPSGASYAWDGNAIGIGENSHIRVSFPSSGLYEFDYGIDSGNGRYQFLINNDFVQKTVEADGSVVYYIPAGTHHLYLDQDSTDGADWSLAISGPTATEDSLPYTKTGGELGGTGNDFSEEWLPIHVGTDTPVNAAITITGADTDAVSLEVWDATTQIETITPVYGTESVWATFTLPANGRLNLKANGANTSEISYEISIIDIPAPTFTWEGTSLAGTLNSTIEMDLQASGLYHIEGNFPVGFASLLIIDPTPINAPFSPNADFDMDVNLSAGLHTFVVAQGASFPTSTWVYTVTLISADAPTITSVNPDSVVTGVETTITVDGTNFFIDGANRPVVKLLGATNYTLVTTHISGTQLTAVVPANVDIDLYDVQVVNPDDQSATLSDGLEVVQFHLYLPLIVKN